MNAVNHFVHYKYHYMFVMACFFLVLRFIGIEADFSSGVTKNGVLLTDEGWYANSAIRNYLGADWYIDGDFNPIINMPLGQIIYYFFFELLGLNLTSIRLPAILAFTGVAIVSGYIIQKHVSAKVAVIYLFVISINFYIFNFSRLAIMEIIGYLFVVISFHFALNIKDRHSYLPIFLTFIFFALSYLTKSTFLAFFPIILLVVFYRSPKQQFISKIRAPGLIAIGVLSVVILHRLLAMKYYSADYEYFNNLNIKGRAVFDFTHWLTSLPMVVARFMYFLGPELTLSTSALIFITLLLKPLTLIKPPMMLSIITILVYCLCISIVRDQPPRYFIPVFFSVSFIFAYLCINIGSEIYNKFSNKHISLLPFYFLGLIAIINIAKIGYYYSHLDYSFRTMANGIREEIIARGDKPQEQVIYGEISDSISILTHIVGVNSRFLIDDPLERFKATKPNYAVVLLQQKQLDEFKDSLGFEYEKINEWDVLKNYRKGANVKLYHISW